MYDQQAVIGAMLESGTNAGSIRVNCGVTDDCAAVYVATGRVQGLFAPEEVLDGLETIIEQAEHEGWLHNPSVLHTIAYITDLAAVVDNTNSMTVAEVEEKWTGFSVHRYDFEDDPMDLKRAIMDVQTRHGDEPKEYTECPNDG